ncbi:MAG: hypothetical protein LBE35_02530 [Clostridiales bacterium]|jgi:hypothetical protein|nr:hypothetical protein [Clostridiales bacterium]
MNNFTAEDFLNVEVFERLNEEFADLERRRREAGRVVVVNFLDLSAGESTIPTVDFINSIEENLRRLAGPILPVGMRRPRVWLGEDRDEGLLDFNDVNRWFVSIGLIRRTLGG